MKLLVYFAYMARVIRVPAIGIMLFWFLLNDVLPTVMARGGGPTGGVAHWAHIGGFVSGAAICLLMRSAVAQIHPVRRAGADAGGGGEPWGNSRGPQRWDSGRGVGGYVGSSGLSASDPRSGGPARGSMYAPANDLPTDQLIVGLWRAGRYSEAADRMAAALRGGERLSLPEPEFLRLSGRLYDEARYDDAKAAFRAYLTGNPRGPGGAVAAFALGMIASRRDGDGPAARSYLAIAAEGHPDPVSRETAARELERLRLDRIR